MERIAIEYPHRINSRQIAAMEISQAERAATDEFMILDAGTRREVMYWIKSQLRPGRMQVSAYWLKHQCERGLTRRYLSCVEMVGALFASGYVVRPDETGKWFFGVDTKAPLFTEEPKICEMPQGTDFRYWGAFHAAVATGKTDRKAFDEAWRAAIGGEAHASI